MQMLNCVYNTVSCVECGCQVTWNSIVNFRDLLESEVEWFTNNEQGEIGCFN